MIAKGKAHDHLAVATERDFKLRITNLGGLAIAGAFSDLFLSLVNSGVADERLFLLWKDLLACLSSLPQEPTASRSQLLFAAASLRLLDDLGYGPRLGTCVSCRRAVENCDAKYSIPENGVLCHDCEKKVTSFNWLSIQKNAWILLKLMRHKKFVVLIKFSIPLEILQQALEVIKRTWQHAPLNKEPHGLVTLQKMLS